MISRQYCNILYNIFGQTALLLLWCVFEESDPLLAFLLPSTIGPCVVVACPLIEPVVGPVLVNIFLLCFGREQSFKKTECCGKI